MSNNNSLELLNMFTKAARIAQANNNHSVKEELDSAMLKEYLKKAFQQLKNDINVAVFLKSLIK